MLVSQGHRPCDLETYAPDKLRLMFELAQGRLVRETAGQGLVNLRTVNVAVAGAMAKKNAKAMKRMESELLAILQGQMPIGRSGEPVSQGQAVALIAQKLARKA